MASAHFALGVLGPVLAAPAAADVLVVDPAGAGDFTQIQPAVEASQEGDIVLVRAGDYPETACCSSSW